jgi:hypothetical protein
LNTGAGTELKSAVYLETSVISYFTARPSRDALQAERQRITREWWSKRKPLFDCFISDVVLDEIRLGETAMAIKRISAVSELPRIPASETARFIAKMFLEKGALPLTAAQDAMHVALAAAAGLEFLLTWNCAHLANAQIEARVTELCRQAGYTCPVICTPEQLM